MEKSILTIANVLSTGGAFAHINKDSKSINDAAPVKCSKSVTINANRERVWAVLTKINNWPAWQTDISAAKLNGDLQPQATFDWKTGGAKIHSSLHTVEANSQFGWTGKTFGMFAIHNWSLQDEDGKTTVLVEESMEGLLASLFKKSFNKSLEGGMQNWLNLLKKECEK